MKEKAFLKKIKTNPFEQHFNRIKNHIIKIGNYTEESLKKVILIFTERNLDHLESIYTLEKKINTSHLKVDDLCWKTLARQSPFGKDLRKVIASIKINSDFERIGDQCCNIASTVKNHFNLTEMEWPKSLMEMMKTVQNMLCLSMKIIENNDFLLAEKILKMDDEVDNYQKTLIRGLIQKIKENSDYVDDIISLILIARNLERIGDHTTNIAEDVIFIQSGKDIRHGILLKENSNHKKDQKKEL